MNKLLMVALIAAFAGSGAPRSQYRLRSQAIGKDALGRRSETNFMRKCEATMPQGCQRL